MLANAHSFLFGTSQSARLEKVSYIILFLRFGPPNLSCIDRLWPFWGVETLHLPLVQPDISTADHGWVGLSGSLPKSPRVQSFHIHGGKLPSGNWGTRSSVLPLEEVYFQGWFHSTSNIFSFPLQGAMFHHGLLFIGGRPQATQHGWLLLLPVSVRCL